MKDIVKLISPAKVNLVLAVGPKQDSGFHEVHTIMHALAFHDKLTMRRFDDEDSGEGLKISLRCETSFTIDRLGIAASDNLAYKAVEELSHELGRVEDETIEIHLEKVIPAQAGLGGGSSNAAAALLGAATLWGIDPEDPRLQTVAARLGADVAFFLKGGCTLQSGKGEVFEHALTPRSGFVLLVRPSAGVSTAEAYRTFDEAPVLPEADYLQRIAAIEDAAEVIPWNNLTEPARKVEPQVDEVLSWAKDAAGVIDCVLCGSGSAVCLTFTSYEDATACSVEARKHDWWSRVTSFSPLGAAVVEAI